MFVLNVAVTLVGKFTAHYNPKEFNTSRSRWDINIEIANYNKMLEFWLKDKSDSSFSKNIASEESIQSMFIFSEDFREFFLVSAYKSVSGHNHETFSNRSPKTDESSLEERGLAALVNPVAEGFRWSSAGTGGSLRGSVAGGPAAEKSPASF
ncbi:hypothetical protein J6590_061162 [Homalodisca vitripennis]|nr:hypothetical protein J6590_061162 [Homalodisca vitripennis]